MKRSFVFFRPGNYATAQPARGCVSRFVASSTRMTSAHTPPACMHAVRGAVLASLEDLLCPTVRTSPPCGRGVTLKEACSWNQIRTVQWRAREAVWIDGLRFLSRTHHHTSLTLRKQALTLSRTRTRVCRSLHQYHDVLVASRDLEGERQSCPLLAPCARSCLRARSEHGQQGRRSGEA